MVLLQRQQLQGERSPQWNLQIYDHLFCILQWPHCESVSAGGESRGHGHRFGVHPLLRAAGSGLLSVHAKD